jgi:hypothetical protein
MEEYLMTERKATIMALAAFGLVAMGAGLLAQQGGGQHAGKSSRPASQEGGIADQGLRIQDVSQVQLPDLPKGGDAAQPPSPPAPR